MNITEEDGAGPNMEERRRRHKNETSTERQRPGTTTSDQNAAIMTTSTTTERDVYDSWFWSVSNVWNALKNPVNSTLIVLIFINLINYMDRSTIAGMMTDIRNDPYFNIETDKSLGLLQTAFVFSYMIFAPIFGYLGDRYDRRMIIGFGVTFWSLSTLIGSFMKNFWWFLTFRALVGIGEASYSTVAPAIISDLFHKDHRSTALAVFYFAIPVGTGLGYMVGSEIADAASDWRWGLRVTPFMGLVALIGIMFFMTEPDRGAAEGARLRPTSPITDLKALGKNKSYVLSTLAFTCVTFSAGALMWWGPTFAYLGAKAACGTKAGCDSIYQSDISLKFGIVMTFAGILGVPGGSWISQTIRRSVPNADPLVSGVTLLISVPILFASFLFARYNINTAFGMVFLAGLLLNCNWSIVSDMTLYIVIPTRRSFASAAQILASHAFGDAISPYLIGVIVDWIRPYIEGTSSLKGVDGFTPGYYDTQFRCLQYALFIVCFCQAMGAYFFLSMSFHILHDKRRVDQYVQRNANEEDDDREDLIRTTVPSEIDNSDSVQEVPIET